MAGEVKSDQENSNVVETAFFLHLSKLVFYNNYHIVPSEEQAGSKGCTRLLLHPFLQQRMKTAKGKIIK